MATTPAAEPRAASRRLSWLRRNSLAISGVLRPHAHPGLEPGDRVRLRGMVGVGTDGRPAMINPAYDLLG